MEMVVQRGNQVIGEKGTAWAYIGRDIEYRMAGKSGTAQVVEIEQGEVYDASLISERQRKHAWFVAFAPVVAPEIAIAVLIENGGGGSEQAAPIARELLDYYLLESKPLATAMTAAGLMP
jgi:penicillin-binding protein 2